MDWHTFREKSLPLLKLYRDDYITLHEEFFEDMHIDQLVVRHIINWLCEKPLKKYLDEWVSRGWKDEYDLLVDIVENSQSFEEANAASHKLFCE